MCLELLCAESVRLFHAKQSGPAAAAALEAVGYRVGQQLAERSVPRSDGCGVLACMSLARVVKAPRHTRRYIVGNAYDPAAGQATPAASSGTGSLPDRLHHLARIDTKNGCV